MSEFMNELVALHPEIGMIPAMAGELPSIAGSIYETVSAKEKASPRQIEVMVGMVQKHLRKVEVAKAAKAVGYFGEVGEKAQVIVNVVSSKCIGEVVPPGWNSSWNRSYRRSFPKKYLIKMHDEKGRILVWFSASSAANELIAAEGPVPVKFKVKEHSEYEGAPQTIVSHLKIEKPGDIVK